MKTHKHTRYSRNKEIDQILAGFFKDFKNLFPQQDADSFPDLRSWLSRAMQKFGDKERKAARRIDIDRSVRHFNKKAGG